MRETESEEMSTDHSTDLERPQAHADPIPDPGLAPHVHRLTDTDPKAARRAERQVALLFALSALGTVGFVVAYVALPLTDADLQQVLWSNLALGTSMGVAMFALGAGAIHWAKKLMPDVEIVEERHPLKPEPETRQAVADAFQLGTEESGFGRRSLIRRSLIGAMAVLPIPAVVLLRDLGPLPGNSRSVTMWTRGVRLVTDVTFEPIRLEDISVGQLINALPETFEELPEHGPERQVSRSKDAVIVVRMRPEEITPQEGRENWHVDGVLCYSRICTHLGCPVSLYEQVTHHVLCPCHQSTFDLADNGKVVFGPAGHALPQLAISVDEEGYLVAQQGFTEPVGPSYWERG